MCVGGGHCNIQVIKLLKKFIRDRKDSIDITLISDSPISHYSGMLPSILSSLYSEEDYIIHLDVLARWGNCEYIQSSVIKIIGAENMILLENGQQIYYDVLCINIGSRWNQKNQIPGVLEYSLITRPIRNLLTRIIDKENEFRKNEVVTEVIICGGGAAGTELSFSFKARWSQLFNKDITVRLLCSRDGPIPYSPLATRVEVERLLK